MPRSVAAMLTDSALHAKTSPPAAPTATSRLDWGRARRRHGIALRDACRAAPIMP